MKFSVILTCVDYCSIVSNKQETITSLIESINNSPENYVLIYKGDISNYPGVNMKKNSYDKLELSLSHLVDKIINHAVIEVFVSLKAR